MLCLCLVIPTYFPIFLYQKFFIVIFHSIEISSVLTFVFFVSTPLMHIPQLTPEVQLPLKSIGETFFLKLFWLNLLIDLISFVK